jgi:hypothetical protein
VYVRMSFTRRAPTYCLTVFAATVIVLAVAGGPAAAGTITAPTNNFTVPTDASQSTGLGFVTISGIGYPPNMNVSIMICNGNNPVTDKQWDPNADCDSGTSTPAINSGPSGTVTFRASDLAHRLTFFDGSDPSASFDCLHRGERNPADGVTHWGGGNPGDGPPCQIIMSTSTVSPTADQAFATFILPSTPQAGCGSSCQPSPTQVTANAPSSQASASAGSLAAASPAAGSSATGSSATASGEGTSLTSGSSAKGRLPFTGLNLWPRLILALVLVVTGACCLIVSRLPAVKYDKRLLRLRRIGR